MQEIDDNDIIWAIIGIILLVLTTLAGIYFIFKGLVELVSLFR